MMSAMPLEDDGSAVEISDLESLMRFTEYLDGQAGRPDALSSEESRRLYAIQAHPDVRLDDAVSAEFLKQDDRMAYYYLAVPLKVFPQAGTYIQSVEITLHFNLGDQSDFPIVQDMFPSQKWKEYLGLHSQVDIGIDELLAFFALLPISPPSPMLKSLTTLRPQETLFRAEYDFLIRAPVVITTGPGGSTASWRFNGRNLFEQEEHLHLGLTFGVPITQRSVRVAKVLKARRRNQSFSKLLAQDVERLERVVRTIKEGFKGIDVEAVLARLKRNLRTEWNMEYRDLPVWDLSEDMCH